MTDGQMGVISPLLFRTSKLKIMKTIVSILTATSFFLSLSTSNRSVEANSESDSIHLKVVLSYEGSKISPAIYETRGSVTHKIAGLKVMDKDNPLAGHSTNFQILSNVLLNHLDCYNIKSVRSAERSDCGKDVFYVLSRDRQ